MGKNNASQGYPYALLSSGIEKNFAGLKLGVVDERGGIAACWGVPQNNLGCRTDVINGINKRKKEWKCFLEV